jgi:Uma2 family endonuclease
MATDARSAIPARSRSKLGYREYCCFPDDGRRHEIIDGDQYVTPAPSTAHQTISKRMQHQLYTQIELAGLGIVFNAPVDVQLTEHDIVQPDLVVILADRTRMITPTKVNGVPDLIIEILSLSNAAHDTALKKQLYERTGVAEYWIADPDNQRLERYRLVAGAYRLEPQADPATALAGRLSVRLAEIW